MRIGLFTDTYEPHINGVATSVLMLENALRKLGHQVFIVTINNENMSYNFDKKNVIRIPGIKTGFYDYRLSGIFPIRAISKIKEWDLDIIHSHTEFGIGTFARIIAKQLNIPVVHTYHTMWKDYTHYINKGHFDVPTKKIVEYLTKFYCDKTATELIVPTKKTYDLFKEQYKYDRNVHIIPTGIEVERFYKENVDFKKVEQLKKDYGINEDDFVILYVGRIAKEKNIEYLIEQQKHIVKHHKNCKLMIVGGGPDLDLLKDKAKKIKENVIFTDKIPWDDVPAFYHLANLFVTASHTETQGLTVIEAMAAGTLVLALDDDAFNTVITDDFDGFLFKDRRKYRRVIDMLIKDTDKLKHMSEQAYISSSRFSSRYYAERVLEVYKMALGDRKLKKKKGFFKRIFSKKEKRQNE